MINNLRSVRSVKGKLLSIAITTCLLLAVFIASNWKAYSIVKKETRTLSLLEEGSLSLQTLMRGLSEFTQTEGSAASRAFTRQAISDFENSYRELLHAADRASLKDPLARDIGPTWQGIKSRVDEYMGSDGSGPDGMEAITVYQGLAVEADMLIDEVAQLAEREQVYAARLAKYASRIAIALAVATMFIVLLLPALIYQDISSSLAKIAKFANRTTQGDLTSELVMQREDEIGVVADSFIGMTSRLRSVIARVRKLTVNISDASKMAQSSSLHLGTLVKSGKRAVAKSAESVEEMDQYMAKISHRSERLASTSREVASSIEGLNLSISTIAEEAVQFNVVTNDAASSVEEMSKSMEDVASSVDGLNQFFEETVASLSELDASTRSIDAKVSDASRISEQVAREATDTGIPTTAAAVEGMEAIRESVSALAKVINRLNNRSNEIGMVITVIEDIADQTQLLALNTSILAAQAGEKGGPFSVIAEGIKQFSIRTSSLTNEVSTLLDTVRRETGSSAQLVHRGIQTVADGVDLVRETERAFKNIRSQADASAKMSKTVHASTAEQANAIMRVSRAMNEISGQVAQITVATQQQREEGEKILESVGNAKMTTELVAKATVGQLRSCSDVARVSNEALEMAGEVDAIISNQRQQSAEIVACIDTIKTAVDELTPSVSKLDRSMLSLREDSDTLEAELEDFTI